MEMRPAAARAMLANDEGLLALSDGSGQVTGTDRGCVRRRRAMVCWFGASICNQKGI